MKRTVILGAGVLLASCVAGAVALARGDQALPAYITAAISDSARPASDTERDANRKPGETLAFAGVKPGMTVLEIAPGKGYYTRLLSAVVGSKGKVFAVTSPPKPGAPQPAVQGQPATPPQHAGQPRPGGQQPGAAPQAQRPKPPPTPARGKKKNQR